MAVVVLAWLVVAELVARRRGSDASWAWTSVLVGVAVARVGWVVTHPVAYLDRPMEMLFVWQGGFLGLAGFVAGGGFALLRLARKAPTSGEVTAAAVAAAVAALVALAALPTSLARPALTEMRIEVVRLGGEAEQVAGWVGRPTVVNLWASWCGPCRRELPLLMEVAGGRDDVRLVLVSQGEAEETVAGYLGREGLPSGDVRRDPARALGRAVELAGYPTSLFVSSRGEVVEVEFGELSRARLLRGMAAIGVPAREASSADADRHAGVR